MSLLTIISALFAGSDSETPAPTGNVLIQISGQSNAMGYGKADNLSIPPLSDISPAMSRTFQRVYQFDKDTLRWKKLFYNNSYAYECLDAFGFLGIGAEIGLAQRWEQENETDLLFIFKDGQGATAIDDHMKGQALYTQFQTRYATAQADAISQGLDLPAEVSAFYWDQGETSGAVPSAYATQFAQLITDKISDNLLDADSKILMVRKSGQSVYQDAYVASNPLASIVPIDGAAYFPDGAHYDAATQVTLGGERAFNLIFDATGTIDGL